MNDSNIFLYEGGQVEGQGKKRKVREIEERRGIGEAY